MGNVKEKQTIVDEVIEQIKGDMSQGDCTVLDELLSKLSNETLIQSLPEKRWSVLRGNPIVPVWNELKNEYVHNGIVHIDAWLTEDENEGGRVIAKVNQKTKDVEYIDQRAKTDSMAQELIKELLV